MHSKFWIDKKPCHFILGVDVKKKTQINPFIIINGFEHTRTSGSSTPNPTALFGHDLCFKTECINRRREYLLVCWHVILYPKIIQHKELIKEWITNFNPELTYTFCLNHFDPKTIKYFIKRGKLPETANFTKQSHPKSRCLKTYQVDVDTVKFPNGFKVEDNQAVTKDFEAFKKRNLKNDFKDYCNIEFMARTNSTIKKTVLEKTSKRSIPTKIPTKRCPVEYETEIIDKSDEGSRSTTKKLNSTKINSIEKTDKNPSFQESDKEPLAKRKKLNSIKINSKEEKNKNPSFELIDESDKEPLARKKRLNATKKIINEKNLKEKDESDEEPLARKKRLHLTQKIQKEKNLNDTHPEYLKEMEKVEERKHLQNIITKMESILKVQKGEVKTSTCICPNLNLKKKVKTHLPYYQLGYAATAESLKISLKESCLKDIADNMIGFHQIFHKENEVSKKQCNPDYNTYKKNKNEKYTVLFTENTFGCKTHKFYVVVFLVRNEIPFRKCQEMRNYFLENFFPFVEEQRQRGNKFSKTDKKSKQKTDTCKCNLKESTSYSFGCSNSLGDAFVCKFSKKPEKSQGRQRFRLSGNESNPELERICHEIADLTSKSAFKYVPEAAKNMQAQISKARACQLGTRENNIFSGLTVIADYCAHAHRDEHDYLYGTNAILSLENEKNKNAQLHFLPEYLLTRKDKHGLALNLGNGSVCFENAAIEIHGTTPVKSPNKLNPSRIGLISYLHKYIDKPNHGEEFSKINKEQLAKENETLKKIISSSCIDLKQYVG